MTSTTTDGGIAPGLAQDGSARATADAAMDACRARLGQDGAPADRALLAAFASGRGAAREAPFRALVERHAGMVAGVCRRLAGTDADDAVQAVFLVLAQRADTLVAHTTPAAWLHRTATQIALRARQSRRLRRRHEAQAAMLAGAAGAAPQDAPDLRAELDAALDQLPDRLRRLLVLHYLEGRSQAETAALLAMSASTCSSLMGRARERLRRALERRGHRASVAAIAPLLARSGAEAAPPNPHLLQLCGAAASASTTTSAASTLAKEWSRARQWRHIQLSSAVAAAACAVAASLALAAQAARAPAPPAHAPPPIIGVAEPTSRPWPSTPAPASGAPAMDADALSVFLAFPSAVQARLAAIAGADRIRSCRARREDGKPQYVARFVRATGGEDKVVLDERGEAVVDEDADEGAEHERRPHIGAHSAGDPDARDGHDTHPGF